MDQQGAVHDHAAPTVPGVDEAVCEGRHENAFIHLCFPVARPEAVPECHRREPLQVQCFAESVLAKPTYSKSFGICLMLCSQRNIALTIRLTMT